MGLNCCVPLENTGEADEEKRLLKRELNTVQRPEFDGKAVLLPLNIAASSDGMKFKEFNQLIQRCSDEKSESFGGRLPLIGICDDSNSSYMKGCENAPNIIRKAFLCSQGSKEHYFPKDGHEKYVDTRDLIIDCGNLEICDDSDTNYKNIGELIKNITNLSKSESQPMPMIVLGGDHSITYPVLAGYKQSQVDDKIGVIHFDAHPDINTLGEYGKYSHASPFTNLFEQGTIDQILQIGIRCMESDSQG
eukprot:442921_1